MTENISNAARSYPSDPILAGQIKARERNLESQRDFWRSMTFILGVLLVGTLGFVLGRGTEPRPEKPEPAVASADEPEPDSDKPERSSKAQKSGSGPSAPSSPGVVLGFDDLEKACGDLSYLPNYLCLVNRGSEQVAGGARLVLTEQQATFESRSTHNGVSIRVQGKERYRLEFGPPKGKAMLPGLYTEAMRWPSNEGPYPGMNVSVGSRGCGKDEGQFRILELVQVESGGVQRMVADFETDCGASVGRIAVEQLGLS